MILFLVFLLLLSAFLSAGETSFFSLSPWTLRSFEGSVDARLQKISFLMKKPRDLLVTILILNVFANLLVQNTVSTLFGSYDSWGLQVGVPLALTLLFGEVLPKSMALPHNVKVARRFVWPLYIATKILRPIRNPITRITSWISRFLFFFLSREKEQSPEELRHVLRVSEEKGVLLPEECDLINGAIHFRQSIVKERMRPRAEIRFYDIQEPIESLVEIFVKEQIARVPVCQGDVENLLGIATLSTFFFHQEEILRGKGIVPFLQKPFFAPETTRAGSLLKTLREKGEDIAMVVDEYGSISGLLTQEDLIEAVVGEIVDRRDEKELFTRYGASVVIASGRLELVTFREIFDTDFPPSTGVVTLGGWLIEQMGEIPQAGETYTKGPFLFHILQREPNRIERIYIRKQ